MVITLYINNLLRDKGFVIKRKKEVLFWVVYNRRNYRFVEMFVSTKLCHTLRFVSCKLQKMKGEGETSVLFTFWPNSSTTFQHTHRLKGQSCEMSDVYGDSSLSELNMVKSPNKEFERRHSKRSLRSLYFVEGWRYIISF